MSRRVAATVLDRLQIQERFACLNRDELEPMLQLYAEDAVFDVSAVFTDVAPVRGYAAMLRYWRELRETWGGGMQVDPLDTLDLGGGRWVLEVRLSGTGTRSGIEVDQRFAFLYTLGEDEKIARAELFADVDAAVAAGERAVLGAQPH